MAKQVKNISKRVKSGLFIKIMLRLSLPLFFLSAIITAIHLTSQLSVLNHLQEIEARHAIQTVSHEIDALLSNGLDAKNESAWARKMAQLASENKIKSIQAYDMLEKHLYFSSADSWTEQDLLASQESFELKDSPQPFKILINPTDHSLNAYLPKEVKNPNINAPIEKQIFTFKLQFSLNNLHSAYKSSEKTLWIIFGLVLMTGLIIGRGLSQSILRPIHELQKATKKMMTGNLDHQVNIRTGDELEELAQSFNHMASAIKDIKEKAEDANPLTQLPGNQAIYHEIKKRIHEKQKFVFFHADLNHFKIFNDHFGLARGDQAIIKTADILKESIRIAGAKSDFVGHQGGDDFVVITQPAHAEKVGKTICDLFDSEVCSLLYDKKDIAAGFTLHLDRRLMSETGRQEMRQFPLLSIGIAGISNAKKDIPDYFTCMSLGAGAKKEVKQLSGSSYLIQE